MPAEDPLGLGECFVSTLILHLKGLHAEGMLGQFAIDAACQFGIRLAALQVVLGTPVQIWPGCENVLNAGFQKNGKTARCEQNGLGSFKPKELKLFCPRAIAGIGKDILSPTTRDRTFFVEMTRQKPNERRERLRERKIEPEASALNHEIEEVGRETSGTGRRVVRFARAKLARVPGRIP